MKLLQFDKDGGEESTVYGFYIIEIKWLFSIVLLKFVGDSREAYHSHAFNSISWLLKGKLVEQVRMDFHDCYWRRIYNPTIKPIRTKKDDFHKVNSIGTSWVISFRGKWDKTWKESTEVDGTYELTHGRKRL